MNNYWLILKEVLQFYLLFFHSYLATFSQFYRAKVMLQKLTFIQTDDLSSQRISTWNGSSGDMTVVADITLKAAIGIWRRAKRFWHLSNIWAQILQEKNIFRV